MKGAFAAILQLLLVTTWFASCDRENPVTASQEIGLTLPAIVQAQIVNCLTCATEPKQWISAEFPVTLTNVSNSAAPIASITVVVSNRTRGNAEIGRNVRPNADRPIVDPPVPANAQATVQAAVVYFPIPPPRDEIVVTVTVAFTDGRRATETAPIVAR